MGELFAKSYSRDRIMNEFFPKNMLVTGSAGFIGSNFVRYILSKGTDIRIVSLDKLTYAGNRANLANLPNPSRHVFVQGDICDRKLVDELLHKYEIEAVVHFAAESHVDRSIIEPSAFILTNVIGTFTLLEAVRDYWLGKKKWNYKHCRFHHVSTDEVYGELGPDAPAFIETMPYLPSSPYSASKAASDHLVRAYFRTYQLPITISNCSNNYGPYQHSEKLIPTVIRRCVEQKPIPVYGDGSNIRDWLYVEDHCRAIDVILTRGVIGETYNIGGNCEMDNLSLVKTICGLMDKKRPRKDKHSKLITFVEDRPGHDWRYAINDTKIRQLLKWKSGYTFKEGLKLTIDFNIKRYFDNC